MKAAEVELIGDGGDYSFNTSSGRKSSGLAPAAFGPPDLQGGARLLGATYTAAVPRQHCRSLAFTATISAVEALPHYLLTLLKVLVMSVRVPI